MASNGSFDHPNLSSINPQLYSNMKCLFITPSSYVFVSFSLTNIILLLPLCILVLYHGFQQWSQRHSTSSAATTMTHCDSFTYHAVIIKLIGVLACFLDCFGIYWVNLSIIAAGALCLYFTWYGQIFFDILTCVARYLAVVHPTTYLSLRNERGVRIRNVTIFCVWILSFVAIVSMITNFASTVVDFFLLVVSLIITTFCSLSVLRVLTHRGPGERERNRERVDKSKLRAFYTILIILAVLVLRFIWSIFRAFLNASGRSDVCVLITCEVWFSLPSSLVLPLLFLHRAGKLLWCKKIIQRGSGSFK